MPGSAMPGLEKHLEPQRVRWAVPAAGGMSPRGTLCEGMRNWTLRQGAGLTRAGWGRAWGAGPMPGGWLSWIGRCHLSLFYLIITVY